jgi:hypothetical protein
MKICHLLVCATVVIGAITGCKNKESQLVGKWNADKGVVVTFNADKTFAQNAAGAAAAAGGAEGTWSFADNKVSLLVTKIGGKPVDEFVKQFVVTMSKINPKAASSQVEAGIRKQLATTIVLNLSDDGKKLTAADPKYKSLSLTKDESK